VRRRAPSEATATGPRHGDAMTPDAPVAPRRRSPMSPGGEQAASYHRCMLRPESWTRPVGASPTRVGAGKPGSRPRCVVERRRAERGVKSLFGGSKRAGRNATRHESCSLVTCTTGEPSRSCHGEGSIRWTGVPDMPPTWSLRGTGSGTYARLGSEQERSVCAALSAKTTRISQW